MYSHMRVINYLFTIFGMWKPFPPSSGKTKKMQLLVPYKIWSLIVAGSLVSSFILTTNSKLDLNFKQYFEDYYKLNNVVVNTIVILLHFLKDDNVCLQLYEVTEKTLRELKICDKNVKMFVAKLYVWLFALTTLMIVCITIEGLKSKSYILIITIPTYLSTLHLVFHLCLILSILKVIVENLKTYKTVRFAEETTQYYWKSLKYFCSPNYEFFTNNKDHFELSCLRKSYANLSTCIQLLEQYHGVQMISTFWLLFTNAVFGVTMVACNKVDIPLLVMARSVLPFLWCFIGCYVNNQITEEVDHIDVLIVKNLIDFRCDQPRKTILQTFKQLVSTSRLQFTACSLFHLNFCMILVTIANIITYSIILIQLFVNESK